MEGIFKNSAKKLAGTKKLRRKRSLIIKIQQCSKDTNNNVTTQRKLFYNKMILEKLIKIDDKIT